MQNRDWVIVTLRAICIGFLEGWTVEPSCKFRATAGISRTQYSLSQGMSFRMSLRMAA